MARKIVIIPTFASSHLLKCWIPNIIRAINPDVILIREGLFPEGPENKGHIDADFKAKWCHPKYKNAGFDFDETLMLQFVHNLEDRKPDESGFKFNPKVFVDVLSYDGITNANDCFKYAVSYFGHFEPEVGDIIFPLEPDAFLMESDADIIQEEISKLKPGEGLKCVWRDFLETQYYCEAINEQSPKVRRLCYCFDTVGNYQKAIDGFMSQNYPLLAFTDKFWVRHYPWFVYDRWKDLRFELIWRKDPQYWKDFESGLQEIRLNSRRRSAQVKRDIELKTQAFVNASKIIPPDSKVLIRPSRSDEARWAKLIDTHHPESISKHNNFIT